VVRIQYFSIPLLWRKRPSIPCSLVAAHRKERRGVLTVLLVEQDLELVRLVVVQRVVDLVDGSLVGELAVHEAHAARLLHDLCAVVTRRLAEGLVAVDDGVVHDLSVGQQETSVRCQENKREECLLIENVPCK